MRSRRSSAERRAIPASPPKLAAMSFPLVDTHCHLYLGELEAQADAAWGRARSAGVVQAVVPAVDAPSSEAVVDFVAARDGLFGAVGVHPNETANVTADWRERIAALLARPKIVALGETG